MLQYISSQPTSPCFLMFWGVWIGCLYSTEWNGGMERWNGMEWNGCRECARAIAFVARLCTLFDRLDCKGKRVFIFDSNIS